MVKKIIFTQCTNDPITNTNKDMVDIRHDVEHIVVDFDYQENEILIDDCSYAYILESLPVVLSESRLLNNFHDGDVSNISKRIKRMMHKAVKETLALIKPQGLYRLVSHHNIDHGHLGDDQLSFKSHNLSKILSNCERTAVFLVTIGKDIDNYVKRVMKRSPRYGYILNYVAAAAVEESAHLLQEHIRDILPEEKAVTYRYSPGYCDWPLSDQQKLFQIIPHNALGVSLSSDSLMAPSKSISGVFGICSSQLKADAINHCARCPKTDCSHRRK